MLTDKLIIDTIKNASILAMEKFPLINRSNSITITSKDSNELVTEIDLGIQKKIIEGLSSEIDKSCIYSEELKSLTELNDDKSEIKILLDPLDGTHNFLHGLPNWGISLAVLDSNNVPIRSYIYLPFMKVLVYSGEENITYFEYDSESRLPVAPSAKQKLSEALIAYDNQFYKLDEDAVMRYQNLTEHCFTTRVLGSSCYDIAMVASGHLDSRIWNDCESYDIAAAFPIIKNSGALLVGHNFCQSMSIFDKKYIAISNNELLNELKSIWS